MRSKGRKQRATPLTRQTVAVLRQWLNERGGRPEDPLFPTSRGRQLSRDAVALLVANHITAATRTCPTLTNKKVSPHTLRHTTAMNLLHAGVDSTVIALWLRHESVEATQTYLHADMAIKERALARTTPPDSAAADTGHQTDCSRSSKRSDYAEHFQPIPTTSQGFRPGLGISRDSA
jgi:site-specific recombinase XerD